MHGERSKLHVVRSEDVVADFPGTTAGQIGVIVLLSSLSVLFIAAITGYLIVRFQNATWRTADMPALPTGLFASTAIIIGVSIALHAAIRAARGGDRGALTRRLVLGLILGLGFLAAQSFNWVALSRANLPPDAKNLYAFTFYMLTGVHAAHVVGGVLPLAVCVVRAQRGRYSSLNHQGVRYVAQYWHFLDVVWIVMLAVMGIAT